MGSAECILHSEQSCSWRLWYAQQVEEVFEAFAVLRKVDGLRQKLEPWLPGVSAYLKAVSDLYRYLEARPDRARTCLGAVFRDLLDDDVREALESPDDAEAELVEAVNRTSGDVTSVFEIPPGEALSFDELSRKVHDAFPAPVSVRVPGRVLERERFEGELQEPLEIPARSLWNAFARLEGRWIAPDLLVAYYRHDQAGRPKGFDLDAFVARPRHAASPPSAEALRYFTSAPWRVPCGRAS